MNKGGGKTRSVGNALRYYLSRMDRLAESYEPRLVIVDEGVDLDAMVLSEFEKTGLMHIETEPQQ